MFSITSLRKKGFAVQFNWLFVLLGGAIILVFFISLITNQVNKEPTESANQAVQELNALLKVSLASRDTQKTIDFGNDKKIFFSCDIETGYSEYYVGRATQAYGRYDYNAIFSPNELESREIIIQTLTFEAPFKVMPVVYATNKDIEYVFVGTSRLVNQLSNILPDATTRKTIHLTQVADYKDNNYDRIIFIVDIRNKTALTKLNGFEKPKWDRVHALVINASGGDINNYGEIHFYKYTQAGFVLVGSSPFINKEFILGGVISHNKSIYDCNIRKILQRIILLSDLHNEKMVYYGNNVDATCKDNYIGLATSAEEHLKNIKNYAGKDVSVENFKNMLITISYLRALNRDIIFGITSLTTECPRIY